MATLPQADRDKIWRGFMRFLSGSNDPISNMLKQDILEAVNATDVWIDNNASAFNASLPATFQSEASASQKALLFSAVALMRYDEETLKLIFREMT